MAETRKGERIELEGASAWYAPHEVEALRSLVRTLPRSAETWRQVALLHGLKAHLAATFVDEAEEASMRRDWAASGQESEGPSSAGQAAVNAAAVAGDMQADCGLTPLPGEASETSDPALTVTA